MAKKMRVRCPKCKHEFEVPVPLVQVPRRQVFVYEEPYQASPESIRLWEKRKNKLKH